MKYGEGRVSGNTDRPVRRGYYGGHGVGTDYGTIGRTTVMGHHVWKKPKKLGSKVRIKDETSEWFGKEGHKQGSRPSGEVLVFFFTTKGSGNLVQLNWEQCERVE